MKVLVVGGAGYIGSHTARALKAGGHQPILFDSLVAGHREVARRLDVPLVVGDLAQPEVLAGALDSHGIEAIMHFAAFAYVGESVTQPAKYYHNNVVGTLNLLDAMRDRGIGRFIFSSTCATYGMPTRPALDEEHPQLPVNPYGWTKLMMERALKDYDRAYGIKHVSLRYFNAAGASPDGLLGEDHDPETHLIPLCLMTARGDRDHLSLFGTDYDTPDGTCIRDYIHVDDLATAHVLALDALASGTDSLQLNVGTGHGHSVREVIRCAEKVTGKPITVVEQDRREGDPPVLVAAADRIRDRFGWQPAYCELEPIIQTAWTWFQQGGRYRLSALDD